MVFRINYTVCRTLVTVGFCVSMLTQNDSNYTTANQRDTLTVRPQVEQTTARNIISRHCVCTDEAGPRTV